MTVSSSPFPLLLNRESLFRARNDMFHGEIKTVKEEISVMERLLLLVPRSDEFAELYNAAEGDSVEVGPFQVSTLICEKHVVSQCSNTPMPVAVKR